MSGLTLYERAAVRHNAAESIAEERGIDTLQALRRIQQRELAEAFNRRTKPSLGKRYFEGADMLDVEARAAKIATILSMGSADFQGEINHFTHGIEDRDYAYDELSALFDIEERNEGGSFATRSLLVQARRALIAIGFYRVMPDEEAERVMVSHGHPWHFKMDGVKYTTDFTTADWQWPEGEE